MRVMRLTASSAIAIAAVLACGSTSGAQSLLGKPVPQHASVAGSASAAAVAPGGTITLWADVTPNPSIHIYAEGAKDFTPVALTLTPGPFKAGRTVYPKPDVASAPGALDAVPAYKGAFRIAVPVTIASTAKPGSTLTVGGAVKYQACDDRLCYPVAVAPVTWAVAVK
jgi:hypothetical protein